MEIFDYTFMQNAFIAIILMSIPLSLLGTLVVNRGLSFFSDTIGHSVLTGLAIGNILSLSGPLSAMLFYATLLSLLIFFLRKYLPGSPDSITALAMSFSIALGIILLTMSENFSSASKYFVGGLMLIEKKDIFILLLTLYPILAIVLLMYKKLVLISIDKSIAKSKGVKVNFYELTFPILLSWAIVLCTPWTGILVVNSLLVLPATIALLFSKNLKSYLKNTLLIGVSTSLIGPYLSFHLGSAPGANISFVMILLLFAILLIQKLALLLKKTQKLNKS